MKFTAAEVEAEGVEFAIVVVRLGIVEDPIEAKLAISGYQDYFPGKELVLMAQREDGSHLFYGRERLQAILSKFKLQALPWKDYAYFEE